MIAVALVLASLSARAASRSPGAIGRGCRRSPAFVLLWVIGMVCAVGAAVQAKYHRLVAVTLMGGAGLVTCLTFVWFSAPDLALTQLVVEVVTTILFLLGLRWLPMRREDAGRARRTARPARGARATCCSRSARAAGSRRCRTPCSPGPRPTASRRSSCSTRCPEGGGTNVVNVMLVDFRAFDTLGEITVLAAVALTVFALLRRFRPPAESIGRAAPAAGNLDRASSPTS